MIKISCFIGTHEQDPFYEILVFCDASINSYPAIVHLHVIDQCGIQTNVIFPKLHLIPLTSGKEQNRKKYEYHFNLT